MMENVITGIFSGIISILVFTINIPMTRKPLSEDDGNWYYPALFWNRGIRIYKNFDGLYGYFCIQWMASALYNLLKIENVKIFYYFKIIWYSLTSVSIYWMAFCFWHNNLVCLISGVVFGLVTALPNSLFVLTYGEHFFILPINLSIIFTFYGISTGNLIFFFLAGLASAWAFQIKPTALLCTIFLPFSFYYAPETSKAIGSYFSAFILLTLLPMVLIRKHQNAYKVYLSGQLCPFLDIIKTSLDNLNITFLNRHIDKLFADLNYSKYVTAYIKSHQEKDYKIQWSNFKKFMLPVIKDLYLILILAGIQLILLFNDFDPFCFSMISLFFVFLLMQQAQKNYYTPHFNPCWAPISILAAKTVWDMWPHLLNSGALGLAMIAFMGVESIKIGRIIIKSFSKSERDKFGFMGPLLGMLFRLSESIGKYIRENSKEDDKLFVWGDQPSIYLYAKREAFDTDYLFIYAHHGRIHSEKELLDSLREKPPELLLFYNYKVNDGWNIDKLQESIGVTYRMIKSFKITDNQGRILRDAQGIIYDFPLYRRDDEKYKEVLLDRALAAESAGDADEARKHLDAILRSSPEDYEASIRWSLLGKNGGDAGESRKYLEQQLSLNDDPITRSILLRLLADIDLSEGDPKSAKHRYEEALGLNSNDFRIFNGLGEVLFSLNSLEKALESFKKALELNHYSADTLNNVGVVFAGMGKRDEARDCFKRALSFMPYHPDALKNMEQVQ